MLKKVYKEWSTYAHMYISFYATNCLFPTEIPKYVDFFQISRRKHPHTPRFLSQSFF